MAIINLKEFTKESTGLLSSLYSYQEANAMIRKLLTERYSVVSIDVILGNKVEIPEQVFADIRKLTQGVPVQHIIGHTWFMDMKFKVSPDVLIPRPETEELVSIIHKDLMKSRNLSIVDLGTGSGCIPISLKQLMPDWDVIGMDISAEALKIANINASDNYVEVAFHQTDIFQLEIETWISHCDVLISNPPYVTLSEKSLMQSNVLKHEPHLALFVPDNEALKYYERIADLATNCMKEDAIVYLEINEQFGFETRDLFMDLHWEDVTLMRDLQDKDRFIRARKKIA